MEGELGGAQGVCDAHSESLRVLVRVRERGCLGEATNADFIELVVLEEGLGSNEVPPAALMHVLDDLVVPVVPHIAETSSEHSVATFLHRHEHFFKKKIVHMVVVHKAGACDKVELVLELGWELLRITQGLFVKLG